VVAGRLFNLQWLRERNADIVAQLFPEGKTIPPTDYSRGSQSKEDPVGKPVESERSRSRLSLDGRKIDDAP